eukprot:2997771-Pyramimonas_sp.AAC.1
MAPRHPWPPLAFPGFPPSLASHGFGLLYLCRRRVVSCRVVVACPGPPGIPGIPWHPLALSPPPPK